MRRAPRAGRLAALLLAAIACLAPRVAGATRLVRVPLDAERTLDRLLEAGLDIVAVKAGASADVLVHAGDADVLARMGATPQLLDDDVEGTSARRAAAELAARPRPAPTRVRAAVRPDGVFRTESLPPFGAGSMGGFWTLEEVKMKLDALVANDTHDVVADKVDTIGTTLQGRPIWGLKIARRIEGPETRPAVLINALTHAREPEGMQALFWFVDDLLAKADVDDFATYLLDHRALYIVPVVNPDGYAWNQANHPGGGGLKRKNLRDTNNNGIADPDNLDGIDLNRNFGYKWGLDNVGSSGTLSSDTYRGAAAFSEPETQAQRDLVMALHPKSGISFHTYSELFLHPWGYTPAATPDSATFQAWSDEAMAGNPSISGPSPRVLYRVNGEFNDWMYGDTLLKPRAYTWTPEVGLDVDGGFWPAPSRIVPLAQENLRTCYTVMAIAGPWVRVESSALLDTTLNAGRLAHLAVRARNRGLADTPANLSATLVPLDAGTHVGPDAVAWPSLPALASGDATGGVTFTLSADDTITPGRLARFEIRFTADDGYFSRDTIAIVLGTPTTLLVEPANDLSRWTSLSSWGVVANDATHPSRYFADSPSGNYAANANTRLIARAPLDLSHGVHAWAQFDARWMLETAYDGTLVEASLDSVTWTPLAGRATLPGNQAPQPAGKPIYQGSRWLWQPERVDLSPFAGPGATRVRLRVRTVADGGTQFDGFQFDSLRIDIYDPAMQPAPTQVAGVSDDGAALAFAPPAPNPARAFTRLAFTLPRAGVVRLEVLDLQGRRVRTLADGAYMAGRWALAWNLGDDAGRAVAPGVYFARLSGAAGTLTRRLVVLR